MADQGVRAAITRLRESHFAAASAFFSAYLNESDEDDLDQVKLEISGSLAGWKFVSYRRFLFDANQIAVFKTDH
jgi:hypothetical protein